MRLRSLFKASPQSIQSVSTVHNLNHPTNMDSKNEATGEFQSLNDSLTDANDSKQAGCGESFLSGQNAEVS